MTWSAHTRLVILALASTAIECAAETVQFLPPATEAEFQFAERLVKYDMRDWRPRPTQDEIRFEAQHTAVARIDLDGDGRLDALFVPHLACDYPACSVYAAVERRRGWTYHEVCRLVDIQNGIDVLPLSSHGLHDLRIAGQVFRFDGRRYCRPKGEASKKASGAAEAGATRDSVAR